MTSKDLRLKMMNEILNGMKVFIRTSHYYSVVWSGRKSFV